MRWLIRKVKSAIWLSAEPVFFASLPYCANNSAFFSEVKYMTINKIDKLNNHNKATHKRFTIYELRFTIFLGRNFVAFMLSQGKRVQRYANYLNYANNSVLFFNLEGERAD